MVVQNIPTAKVNGGSLPLPSPVDDVPGLEARPSRSTGPKLANAVQPTQSSTARVGPPLLVRTIEQAALDQEVDPVKFDRLISVQERIAAKEARVAFETAFAKMQAELPVISEHGVLTDSNGHPSSTYALWEDINEAIKPILARFDFGLRFRIGQDHNTIVITAILSHASGHAEETAMRLPVDFSGGKNPVQAIGSSTSYGKRYTASALLNITSRGEDDDGKAALQSARISPEEVAELRGMILAVKGDERRLTNYLGVPSLEELPPSKLEKAKAVITAKAGRP